MAPDGGPRPELEAELLEKLKRARKEFLAAKAAENDAARNRYLEALQAFTTLLRKNGTAA